MSLEAIAALLGHHDLSMTMVYARIADRTVADEYFAVTEQVETPYAASQPAVLPADTAGPAMRALRAQTTKWLLGYGYCTRPLELAQYTSVALTAELLHHGMAGSIGTVGDCLLTGQSDPWGVAA